MKIDLDKEYLCLVKEPINDADRTIVQGYFVQFNGITESDLAFCIRSSIDYYKHLDGEYAFVTAEMHYFGDTEDVYLDTDEVQILMEV